jgi:hypothetical protein
MEHLLGLRFTRRAVVDSALTSRPALTAADLAATPKALRARLREALLVAESWEILSAIDAIGSSNPELAKALRTRAADFDYDALLRLLEGRA